MHPLWEASDSAFRAERSPVPAGDDRDYGRDCEVERLVTQFLVGNRTEWFYLSARRDTGCSRMTGSPRDSLGVMVDR